MGNNQSSPPPPPPPPPRDITIFGQRLFPSFSESPPPPPPPPTYVSDDVWRTMYRTPYVLAEQQQAANRQAAEAAAAAEAARQAAAAEAARQAAAAEAARQAAEAARQQEEERQRAISYAKNDASEAIAAADAAIAAVKEAETAGASVTSLKTAAETAKTNAVNAQTAANNAQTTSAANAAKSAADNAKNDANTAKNAAIRAYNDATQLAITAAKNAASEAIIAADAAIAAVREAETAGASVTSLKTAAETAKTNALNAQTAANSAKTTSAANAAKSAADNAKNAANAAKNDALGIKTTSVNNAKTAAIGVANEAISIADVAIAIANEAIRLEGSSVAAAQNAKTKATEAKTEANTAKTSAEGATTVSIASAAKTAAEAAKTKATEAKRAADDAKAGNVASVEAKCKTPAIMKFTAKVEPNAAIPASGPVSPNVYWTVDSTGPNKEFISIPDKDKDGNDVIGALQYCGKVGKFLILYNSSTKDRNIQYKILANEKTNSNNYFKFNVEIVGGTTGFTKANLIDGQDIFIRTSETQVISQGPSVASSTFKNACTDPESKTFANCKPVCIPTDGAGNILYKDGTSLPRKIVESKNQWLANYYEYRPVRGIGGDGSVQYLPMDPSKTFVGGGTDCTEPCPPYDTGGKRPAFCRPPDTNWGKQPVEGEKGICPRGCIKVDDPTSRRNSSACKYDKASGYTCRAVCDFNADSECRQNNDCANCRGSDYITKFPTGWKPTLTRRIQEIYSRDDCNHKCKKATVDTCRNFLQLEQSGAYLESRCRKIGTSGKKVICGPISNNTQTGLVSGYDMCITCKSNKNMYAYFEFDKQWNNTTRQWDFINIREILNPSASWFEGDVNSFSEGGDGRGEGAGSGEREGGGGGANLRGSKPSRYQEDRNSRYARDSRDMGEIQSNNNSKLIYMNSASQNAKRQEIIAKVSAMKIQLDKMTSEYNNLEENVKLNKIQMDKAENDCYDINVSLRRAVKEYTDAEAISLRYGSTVKEKRETEAANTRMYTVKQNARDICNIYDRLKEKHMMSVNELNSLKNKINDLRAQYNTASASVGGGDGGSFLSPIINIFFGDDANRDCSGQLGCGNGIDYAFPSPFNSSVGGKFTPQPFYGSIRL